jgi:hypothetical protein
LIGVLMRIFFFKTGVFMATVAADAADRSWDEQQQTIDRVLCISRTSSLLIPVMSPAGSCCAVIPVLHDCSLCNLLRAAILRLAGRNCSKLEQSPSSVFLGTHDGDVHPHTTGSEEAACSAPRCGHKADKCSTV